FDAKASVMFGNNALTDRKSETRAFADRLGRKERIEDATQVLDRDTGTVVLEKNLDRPFDLFRANRQAALAVAFEHRLFSIDDQIQEYLLQLMRIAQGLRQIRREIGDQLDIADFQFVRAQINSLRDDAVDVRRFPLRFLLARKSQQVLD